MTAVRRQLTDIVKAGALDPPKLQEIQKEHHMSDLDFVDVLAEVCFHYIAEQAGKEAGRE